MATAALRHDKTLAEIASEHSISPVQAVKWKKQALEGLLSVFEDGCQKKAVSAEEDQKILYEKIGRLEMQLDWLKKCDLDLE